jgi:hypothetical protein
VEVTVTILKTSENRTNPQYSQFDKRPQTLHDGVSRTHPPEVGMPKLIRRNHPTNWNELEYCIFECRQFHSIETALVQAWAMLSICGSPTVAANAVGPASNLALQP